MRGKRKTTSNLLRLSSAINFNLPVKLRILCRVSELLVSAEQANAEHVATMDNLCCLLVRELKLDSHPNQLYLVRTVNSLIPKLSSAEAAMTHFHSLSKVSSLILCLIWICLVS